MSTWDALVGDRTLRAIRTDVHHPFDPHAHGVALDLDDVSVFIFEDPSDGYRSSCNQPMVIPGSLYQFADRIDYINVPVRITRWTVSEYLGRNEQADGLEFRDRRNDLLILRVGTDHADDYYPSYTCQWHPENIAENMAKKRV